jgi:hypothetical protein
MWVRFGYAKCTLGSYRRNYTIVIISSPVASPKLPSSTAARSSVLALISTCAIHTVEVVLGYRLTREQVRPVWRLDRDIFNGDITARRIRAADQIPDNRVKLLARYTTEILHQHVRNRQSRWILIAQRKVALAIALRDFDGVVDVVDYHALVRDVFDVA